MSITEKKSSGNEGLQQIMDINGFDYEVYPDLSTCVNRTQKTTFAKKTDYNLGETIEFVFNTGSDFINMEESWLEFDFEYTAPVSTYAMYWGSGESSLNLFSQVRVIDRSGNEIERLDKASLVNNMRYNMGTTNGEYTTSGSLLKQTEAGLTSVSTNEFLEAAHRDGSITFKQYKVPLKWLCGLFEFPRLMPPQLMSGLRLEIVLESDLLKAGNWRELANMGSSPIDSAILSTETGLILKKVQLQLDSCKQADSIATALNRRAANEGLEIPFKTWFSQSEAFEPGTHTMTLNKSVSRAFKSVLYRNATFGNNGAQASIACFQPWVSEWQFKAGNLYFPQQPVRNLNALGNNAGGVNVKYLHRAFNVKDCLVSDENWGNRSNLNSFPDPEFDWKSGERWSTGGMGYIAMTLERSTCAGTMSGIPLNNSRSLELTFTDSDQATTCTLMVEHLKIVRCFMDNTEIEE